MQSEPTIARVREEDLLEAPENPNRMEPEQYAMLVEAIRKVGFLQPILLRPAGSEAPGKFRVIDGHHRLRAAREIGMKEVPCVVVDKSDDEAAALTIGMNRLRGELDLTATARAIGGLVDSGWKLGDLTITGFSADEIADLMRSLRGGEDVVAEAIEAADAEDAAERPAKPFSLEILFSDRDEYKRARRGLKKAAGKGGDLGRGLLHLLGEE